MSTLADSDVRASVCVRIGRLDPKASARWGRMTAHQMVCHLHDSFLVSTGEKYASPAANIFTRTVIKWIAIRTPLRWRPGFRTRPEIEQGRGGTPPVDWARDCEQLRIFIARFGAQRTFSKHPVFGEMSQKDWFIWGYRHVDHHLRQFGV
jgi:hypothetical protein